MNTPLTKRYEDRLAGVLSCYDRIVISGTLPGACYGAGMTSFLDAHDIRIFDDPRFAESLRERIRSRAQELASAAGIVIEQVAKAQVRKEALVAAMIEQGGTVRNAVKLSLTCTDAEAWG